MVSTWFRLCVFSSLALGTCCSASFADLLGASYFDDSVYRFDEDTGAIFLAGGIAAGSAGLSAPGGVATGPDGNIYVSSQGTGEILFYDGATGDPLPSPQPGGDPGLFATMPLNGGFPAYPSRMRFDPDGKLYVADFGGPNVRVFDTDGSFLGDAATVGINVGGLTFGPDGDLYVGDFSAATILHVHDGMQETFVTAGDGGLLNPSSLLFLPGGDLLVVDLGGNKIRRYDENGQYVEDLAEIPPTGGDSNSPSDIMLDADGNLVISTLGPTYPPDNQGALFRYDLEDEMLGTIADHQWPLGGVAWIASSDAVQGDYDGNGVVQEADFEKWREDFGKLVAPGGGADGNGDGVVGAADYPVWRDALETLGSGSAATVPEPACLWLIWCGAWLAAGRRRRR